MESQLYHGLPPIHYATHRHLPCLKLITRGCILVRAKPHRTSFPPALTAYVYAWTVLSQRDCARYARNVVQFRDQ